MAMTPEGQDQAHRNSGIRGRLRIAQDEMMRHATGRVLGHERATVLYDCAAMRYLVALQDASAAGIEVLG